MITDEQIKQGLDKAYKQAGHNAYFGNGFEAGVKFALEQVKNIAYEPLLGTGLCENCGVPKMTNSGNGTDEPTNPVLWCHKESMIIEPVPECEQTAECAGFEPCY
jgi:hypothetical protein